jgi:hypothetical protein
MLLEQLADPADVGVSVSDQLLDRLHVDLGHRIQYRAPRFTK